MFTFSSATEALVLARAEAEGKTPDEVVQEALAAGQPRSGRVDWAKLRDLQDRIAALPVIDDRSEKEICDEGWGL